nr:ATP-binding cassette domain-containing protein [bacterium]
ILRHMAANGCSIIIITHKLAEVCEIADRVTVLRRGKTIATVEGEDVNYRYLSHLLVGGEAAQSQVQAGHAGADVLSVEHVSCKGDKGQQALDDISFTLKAGEIMCVAGVSGNGQRELPEAIAGLRSYTGRITLEGKELSRLSVRDIIRAGIAYVPEDRMGMGLAGGMNAMDNLALKDTGKGFWMDYGGLEKRAKEAVCRHDIAMTDVHAPVGLMSGGNLQKLLLAREIAGSPKVLVVCYPVRGLDLNATEAVYRLILQERERGCAVLMISEDLDAILRYADRVMVLYRGRVMGILPREQAKVEEIGMMMLGTTMQEVIESYEKTFDRN